MRSAVALAWLIYLMTGRQGVNCGIFNAGPYNLKLVRHENCEDIPPGEAAQDLRISKKSTHKAFLPGFLYLPYDLDDNVHGQMNFSRLGSRGWGKNAYKLRSRNFCEQFFKTSPGLFEFYFKSLGIEDPKCPIGKGNYTVDMDTDIPRLSRFLFLPYGTYRISQALYYGDPPVCLVCSGWYVTCTDRPR